MRKIVLAGTCLATLAVAGWFTWQRAADTAHINLSHTISPIPTSPEKLFALVQDFRRWTEWSRHEAGAPPMRRTYTGAPSGKGAVYEWDGDDTVGAGRATISQSTSPATLVVELDLSRPIPGHLTLRFTFAGADGKASAEISTGGPRNLVARVYSMFFSVDR